MASSLAEQLKLVASAAPTEERLKGKASLLYDIREAADIDLETIYAVGLQGASLAPRVRWAVVFSHSRNDESRGASM